MYNNAILSYVDYETTVSDVKQWTESTKDFHSDRILICFNISPVSHKELVEYLKKNDVVLYLAKSNPVSRKKYCKFEKNYTRENSVNSLQVNKYYFYSTLLNKGYEYLTYIPDTKDYEFSGHPVDLVKFNVDEKLAYVKSEHINEDYENYSKFFGTFYNDNVYYKYDSIIADTRTLCNIFFETFWMSLHKPIDLTESIFSDLILRNPFCIQRKFPIFRK